MRPLLAIAGASLDNSLVYGEIFYLDTMLWKFRQMTRNLANFSIGLIFLGSVLASFFYQNSEKLDLKKILKNTFIAGILINMSRWVVSVILDLSTIGVVALGALPLSVIGQDVSRLRETILARRPSSERLLPKTAHDVQPGWDQGDQSRSDRT